jgi:hypothetical protein
MNPYGEFENGLYEYPGSGFEMETPPAAACDNKGLPTPNAARKNLTDRKVTCPTRAGARGILSKAVATAVKMLDNTIGELTRAREAACRGEPLGFPNLGDLTACWLKYKLGVCIDDRSTWTAGTFKSKSVAEVIRRLVRPRDLLATNQITFACEATCDPGTNAWVVVRDAAGNCINRPAEVIHLCPGFWSAAHAPFREQTIIHEAVHLTHCAGGVEDTARAASIGSPECLAQFVVATNAKKLDPHFVSRCGFTKRCGPVSKECRLSTAAELEYTQPWNVSALEYDVPPKSAITVRDLANGLADLVWLARNPSQKGKTLTAAQAAAWRNILNDEIVPFLRQDSPEWKISQLIFFARNPAVRGRFKQLPKGQQQKLSKEFELIRTNEVRPWLSLQIARGKVNSRTIFVADVDVFKTLPALTRNTATDELASQFQFVGAAEPKAPMRVILLEPNRYPESYNHSDAVVAVTSTIPSAYINVGFRQQTNNINRTIRGLKGRLVLDDHTRAFLVPDRSGQALMRKFVLNIPGIGNAAITQMISAVRLKEIVSYINDEVLPARFSQGRVTVEQKLADDPAKWTEAQQRLVGLALGRAMAHEVRHLYVADPIHAATGLGSDGAQLFGKTPPAFSTADRSSILAAIRQFESQQGAALVITTYNNTDDRAGDFPF